SQTWTSGLLVVYTSPFTSVPALPSTDEDEGRPVVGMGGQTVRQKSHLRLLQRASTAGFRQGAVEGDHKVPRSDVLHAPQGGDDGLRVGYSEGSGESDQGRAGLALSESGLAGRQNR